MEPPSRTSPYLDILLYTSSVQDIYLSPRFLLHRQSYALYQGFSLVAINQL